MKPPARRRQTIREPVAVEVEDNGVEGNESSSLTQQGVSTIIMHAAMLFLDTPRCFEQLLHWKKEVSKPKIAVCLASKAFVMRLLQDIMKEPGHTGILFESVKAIMNVDHTTTRKMGERTPLEVILPQVLSLNSPKAGKTAPPRPTTSGTQLMSDLVPFLLRQVRLYGIGSNQLPPHVGENLADMLAQVWQHMTTQTMPVEEVETMMAAIERLAKQWHEASVAVLVASCPRILRILYTVQLCIKRALELSQPVLESPEYKTARLLLQELHGRLQVELGAWTRLSAGPLHSPLPGPVKIRSTPDDPIRPSTASTSPPLANWVKVGPGRVRPWRTSFQLSSPKDRLSLPWKDPPKKPQASLEQTLKPLAPEFLAQRTTGAEKPTTVDLTQESSRASADATRRRLQSGLLIKRKMVAFLRRRATQRQLESQREHFERMMALSQSTSTALLADLRYMQAQVGGFVPGQRVEEPEEEKISEEEQNEFRQYLQKAGVKR